MADKPIPWNDNPAYLAALDELLADRSFVDLDSPALYQLWLKGAKAATVAIANGPDFIDEVYRAADLEDALRQSLQWLRSKEPHIATQTIEAALASIETAAEASSNPTESPSVLPTDDDREKSVAWADANERLKGSVARRYGAVGCMWGRAQLRAELRPQWAEAVVQLLMTLAHCDHYQGTKYAVSEPARVAEGLLTDEERRRVEDA